MSKKSQVGRPGDLKVWSVGQRTFVEHHPSCLSTLFCPLIPKVTNEYLYCVTADV